MHYIGMEAMRLPAMCHYSVAIVVLSVALAIGISWVALWLTFHLRDEKTATSPRKLVGAIVMGGAIPIMHYTGMAAVTFMPAATAGVLTHSVKINPSDTIIISIFTVTILGATILTSEVGREFSAQASHLKDLREDSISTKKNLAQAEERLRLTLRASGFAVWNWDINHNVIDADENSAVMFGLPPGQFPKTMETFRSLIHPEDRDRVQQEVAASIERHTEYDSEFCACPLG